MKQSFLLRLEKPVLEQVKEQAWKERISATKLIEKAIIKYQEENSK